MTPLIRYTEAPPPVELAEAVRNLWSFSASDALSPSTFTLPPDPCLSLAIVRVGPQLDVRIVGPHLRPLGVPVGPGSQVRGVRFHPDCNSALLGLAPPDWPDRNDSAAAIAPALVAAVRACKTIDAGSDVLLGKLASRADHAPPFDPFVRSAIAAIEEARGELRVSDLAASLGVSPRTLQRRFLSATGLAAKPYARVRRFLLAMGSNVVHADPEPWGRVAAEFGYADQAHFVRECHALTGVSPTTYAERMAPIRHVNVRP